jgi:REP element-mobilizing transposase RayT
MGRPLRIEYPGALYHITARGNERKDIFFDNEDKATFLGIIEDYHDRFGILIHAFVLMDNHYHLILETPQGNLLKIMHGINAGYTGYFNRRHGRSGHLFQGRYKGILVEKESYLLQLSCYVHLNPMRARIVETPEHYAWSSYPSYIGKGKEYRWVEYSWVLTFFDRDKAQARRKYRQQVEEASLTGLESPARKVHGRVILGSEGFVEEIKQRLSGKLLSAEIPERKRLLRTIKPEDVLSLVAEAFGTDLESILGKRSRANTARKAAIYFVQRHCGLTNYEVGRFFGGIHYSAVTKAATRFLEEAKGDGKQARLIESLEVKIRG